MAVRKDYNPFANQDLHIPKAYQEEYRRYSRTLGAEDPGKANLEETPFTRYIDVWLLAACLGARSGAFVPLESDEKHRFITGAVLQSNPDAIELLMLLAIAHTNDPFVVVKSREVLDIAEGYAAGGTPLLLEMLKSGQLSPMINLTRGLLRLRADGEA